MNWLVIVILLVLIAYTVQGYRRGMLRVLYSLFGLIVTILFVAWTTPYISKFIKENTQIYQHIEEKCEERVRENTQQQISDKAQEDTNLLAEYGITLPDFLEDTLLQKVQEGSDAVLESTGAYSAMAQRLAEFAVDGIAFFISLIVCAILLHFIGRAIDIVSKIPVLKGINQILGLMAGLLQGLIIVWIFCYFITATQAFPFGQHLMTLVRSSRLLTILYDNNMVLYMISIFL